MRRRRTLNELGRKNVFDKTQVDRVGAAINKMEGRTIAVMCPRDFTAQDVICSLFEPEDIKILKAAHNKVEGAATSTVYRDLAFADVSVDFHVRYKTLGMAAGAEELVKWNTEPAHEGLMLCLHDILRIHKKFQKVRNVFKFLNEHGTAGAVRYYWPTVLSLICDPEALSHVDGYRYRDIGGISAWIPAMRETAATVAAAHLLPPDTHPAGQYSVQCWFRYGDVRPTETFDLI